MNKNSLPKLVIRSDFEHVSIKGIKEKSNFFDSIKIYLVDLWFTMPLFFIRTVCFTIFNTIFLLIIGIFLAAIDTIKIVLKIIICTIMLPFGRLKLVAKPKSVSRQINEYFKKYNIDAGINPSDLENNDLLKRLNGEN